MLTKEERQEIAERITFEFDFTEDDDDDMTAWVFSELSHVAEQLESLGDSDD